MKKNTANLRKIVTVLAHTPDGLWVRELARRTGLKPMSVSYYVTAHPELFDEQSVAGATKPLFRLVKLRKGGTTRRGTLLSRILAEVD